MPENILIAIAWPYANAEIHVGNLTGSHLPGDIVARYHRLKGNHVLMVSGTDSHGTPVSLRADAEGKPVESIYKKFHESFLQVFRSYGITYDLFTSTHTENHFKVSQSIFLALKENGFMFKQKSMQWYSPDARKFLPDRYVEGTCYICGDTNARSDQCDKCGNVLEPEKILNPRAKTGDGALELRETEHYYMDLSKLEPKVKEFLRERASHMRDTVLGESLGKIEAEGLLPRPITRDLDWGIPVPVEGWDDKCLYVWFEAVIGYLSAAIEWSRLGDDKESWREWWLNPDARQFYFIGKDNIFFHTSLWPAQLMGAGGQFLKIFAEEEKALALPYDIPANQFMNLEGQKISGSRNWAIWCLDAITRYDADALRYYLTVNMPENKDSDWDWAEFVARNNNELVANWGNLANRVLSFIYKHWEGVLPDPGELRAVDTALLNAVEAGFESVGRELDAVHLRAALQETLRLSSEVNKYLDVCAPWFEIKTDKNLAAKSVFTSLKAIDALKIMFAPFLPFSSEKLHTYLGYSKPLFGEQYQEMVADSLGEHAVLKYRGVEGLQWKPGDLRPGTLLRQPAALFKKLDEKLVDEERSRLGK
ncbi:MAG: methionine--tRNA ligase [Chloroflexi bacterium GWB2_49_20]|nr:MAG: methionine--tRNA ligase [Chloroflexi bacterium GWB2_49_20]OGN76678.1 MAG: methionine--tRNA ligase [Chloroflexi bacterium GWC2_49_37]OGN83638.1 MAG: methionine--tRNA ligase [Chloroflexi bacterium GWD2_49_16]HBG74240.1 methionine--tRNA ligase [Anaerolineae bacterium]HCC79446.1 methionine--tRNA ligase [Anaerolineae bacterium]